MIHPCTSCGANVFWVVPAPSGKSLQVDAMPTFYGNLVLEQAGPDAPRTVRVLRSGERAKQLYYTSHLTTCPSAPRWRKERIAVVR